MTLVVRLLELRRWTRFVDPRSGEVRDLKDPDAPASGRQLARLNRAGMVAIVDPGQVRPLTVGQAAYAIDLAGGKPPPPPAPRTAAGFS